MQIQLSEHFTYKKLLRFVLPSIVMMIFTSIYGVVDGLFVSNYVGKTAFAAVNLIMPFLMAISALGFMIGTGGSAIVAKTLGEGKKKQANEYFSMLVYLTLIGGIVLSALGILFSPLIARGLGADGALLTNCVLYARITLLSMPAFMLQNVFQSFFVTAEKPKLGLGVIVIAGVTNMVLDFLLVGVFQIGLAGAAFATVTSECIGGLFPILYFARKNSSLLKLGRTHFNGKIFLRACGNGSSELMTNHSSSIVNSLYNIQLMNLAGENGVAAYGVLICAAVLLAKEPVMRLFAAQDSVRMVSMGVDYLTLMAFFYILPGITNGIQGYFRGMGEMKTTLTATFIQISIRALVVAVLVPRIGLIGAAWACAVGWSAMLCYTFARYRRVRENE